MGQFLVKSVSWSSYFSSCKHTTLQRFGTTLSVGGKQSQVFPGLFSLLRSLIFGTLFISSLYILIVTNMFRKSPTVTRKAEMMTLLSIDDDLIRFTGARSIDDVCSMPSNDRRAILCKYLVKETPVLIQEPIAWSNEESIGRFLLLKKLLNEDKSRQHLLLEARRVFYEENSFVIYLSGFSRFLDDVLGDWDDIVAVEMLVRDLTIKVEREKCQCGQLMEYMQRLSYFTKMPQLQRIVFEWHTTTNDTPDGSSQGWSTPSRRSSKTGYSAHSSTNDDENCSVGDVGDSNDYSGWGIPDDAWSLEEGIEG